MILALNLLTIFFNVSATEIVINAPEDIVVDSNREMELTLDDTLSPPSAEMVVIKHELLTGIYEKPLFCIRLSVEEDAVYRASARIYTDQALKKRWGGYPRHRKKGSMVKAYCPT